MKPHLYLDVDGVLLTRDPTAVDKVGRNIFGFTLYRAAGTAHPSFSRLWELYDIHWTTNWQDKANLYVADIFKMPTLAVLRNEHSFFSTADKLRALQNHVPQDRPFAWVDDQISGLAAARKYLATRQNCLLISPYTLTGLTHEHVDELLAFATAPTNTYIISEWGEENGQRVQARLTRS